MVVLAGRGRAPGRYRLDQARITLRPFLVIVNAPARQSPAKPTGSVHLLRRSQNVSSIVRISRPSRDRFTTLSHHAVRNRELSRRARGLLWELCSYPENWELSKDRLEETASDSKHKLETAMKELQDGGYLRIAKMGTGESVWLVTDDPDQAPLKPKPDNQVQGAEPKPDNPAQDNRVAYEETLQKKKPTGSPSFELTCPGTNGKTNGNLYTPGFERLWAIHRQGGKKPAARAYHKAIKVIKQGELEELVEHYRDRVLRDGFDGCHLSTWLNGEYWEAEREHMAAGNHNGRKGNPMSVGRLK